MRGQSLPSPTQVTNSFWLAYPMCFLVSWPHSSWMGPLEGSSPTLLQQDQHLSQIRHWRSRGVLSVYKNSDLTASPGILLQCLTTFILGERGKRKKLVGISLAPTHDYCFLCFHCAPLSRICLLSSTLHPSSSGCQPSDPPSACTSASYGHLASSVAPAFK